jgi:hypothetical protein
MIVPGVKTITKLFEYRKVRLIALILFACPPFLFLTILGVVTVLFMPTKNLTNYLIAIPFACHVGSWWVNEGSNPDLRQICRIINILIIVAVVIFDLIIISTDGIIPRISM